MSLIFDIFWEFFEFYEYNEYNEFNESCEFFKLVGRVNGILFIFLKVIGFAPDLFFVWVEQSLLI
jgi:hypothetical protein